MSVLNSMSPSVMLYLTYYLIAVNFGAFAAFGIDKMQAESGGWRIRESTLLWFALLGGFPGAIAGRQAFRHKTRKQSFNDQLYVMGFLQLVAIGLFFVFGQAKSSPFGALFESDEERQARIMVEQSIYYPGCNAVRAVGKAPLRRGQPGYREDMDGDGDGVACEPRY